MLHFATFFDKNYLSRGLVLYDSLKEHCSSFELYILCIDEFTLAYFTKNRDKYPEIKTIQLNELEESDKELKGCKQTRSTIEYYFTFSPCLPQFLLKKFNLPHICTLDADILFLDNPERLFNYLETYSIIITPHKFSAELISSEKYGINNVSFQIFKNDASGVACLYKWRQQCIEWCGDYLDEDNNRFADQKYLDNWPALYPNELKILDDAVSGLAPWNLNNYEITKKESDFYSNGQRIIFYHFHHFKFLNYCWATQGFEGYRVKPQKAIDKLYLTYWRKVANHTTKSVLKQDNSTRYTDSSNIFSKLFNEKSAYLKLMNKIIIRMNFDRIPTLLKRVILKLYA